MLDVLLLLVLAQDLHGFELLKHFGGELLRVGVVNKSVDEVLQRKVNPKMLRALTLQAIPLCSLFQVLCKEGQSPVP